MARPPKFRTKDGRPIRRIGERRLTATDGSAPHPLVTIEEACGIVACSKDLIAQLTNAGVIRVIGADSEVGARLYSKRDCEAVANQLYGDGTPAEVAVGLGVAVAK